MKTYEVTYNFKIEPLEVDLVMSISALNKPHVRQHMRVCFPDLKYIRSKEINPTSTDHPSKK